ncbi:hypothetical protein GW17_00016981 [Ensete ventricosum]|nr:hypothetical protein GW17_00016981 [Ensete ventricosum]
MMHIGLAIACRSRVSEVPSLTLSAGLALGWRCLCHIGRSGRGSIITLIILPSREGGFLEVRRKRGEGSLRSIALVHVSGGAALTDSGTADALAAMRSNFDVDSTVTTCRLVEVRKNYFIPSEYELHAPLPGERPYNAFSSGFSLSTDALEAGLRFPLHPVVEACLERWQISPS